MFDDELYITVTGLNHYYCMKPIEIGSHLLLIKEPDNDFDEDAIMVQMPVIGKIGYVANSPHTLAKGCLSAGHIYDKLPNECAAVVRFMTASKVIARVFPDKKLNIKVDVSMENI